MNIYQCQNKAKDIGFDKAKFLASFPAGVKQCRWVDAYFGFFQIDADGLRDGFVTVDQIDKAYPNLIVTEPYLDEESPDSAA